MAMVLGAFYGYEKHGEYGRVVARALELKKLANARDKENYTRRCGINSKIIDDGVGSNCTEWRSSILDVTDWKLEAEVRASISEQQYRHYTQDSLAFITMLWVVVCVCIMIVAQAVHWERQRAERRTKNNLPTERRPAGKND